MLRSRGLSRNESQSRRTFETDGYRRCLSPRCELSSFSTKMPRDTWHGDKHLSWILRDEQRDGNRKCNVCVHRAAVRYLAVNSLVNVDGGKNARSSAAQFHGVAATAMYIYIYICMRVIGVWGFQMRQSRVRAMTNCSIIGCKVRKKKKKNSRTLLFQEISRLFRLVVSPIRWKQPRYAGARANSI